MMEFFFFKQKTAYEMRISDWSSDVCSSDLGAADLEGLIEHRDEVERIIALAPIGGEIAAEIAARHRAADGAVIGIDADRRGGAADLAVRGAEEEIGGAILRESEAADRGSVGRAQFDPDAIVERPRKNEERRVRQEG